MSANATSPVGTMPGPGAWLAQASIWRHSGPSGILLGVAGLLVLFYLVYRRALPKPLPRIPHNEAAAKTILGDLPELYTHMQRRDLRGWMSTLPRRLNSPIVQLFARPFSKPAVVISDFVTEQDILLRRSKEFDRPWQMTASLRGVIPNHHIAMLTSDPQFRRNRELVKDLMTPNFLHTVNAPEIWRNGVRFVELWRLKARIADGRPFDAAEDVSRMTFDTIKNVAIGQGEGEKTTIEVYHEQIRSEFGGRSTAGRADDGEGGEGGKDAAFRFPQPPHDETLEAQYRMNKALTPSVPLPPTLWHAFNNLRPHMREAYASKERMLRKQVSLAVKRMEANEPLGSALDYMIQREIGAAKKEQRAPVFDSPFMYDELYGYLGAGHDTTATTFQWGMKHLAQNPEAQRKAREGLRAVYAEAHAQRRQPSVAEITRTQVPYLEAVIEEILRLSGPVGATARETTVDTVIMGRAVPRGTTVFLAMFGPSFTSPSVRDAAGTDGAAGGKPHSHTKRGNWDGMDPESFVPERWLTTEGEGGAVAYDAQAGPMLGFSLGIRGCFGRRLAYLTLRMLFTMLIWNFELAPVPEELDSWQGIQILTRKPVQCYVRLAEAK